MSLTADRILILLQSREIKQRASSFHLSRLSIIDGSSSCLFELKKKEEKRTKLGLCVSCAPSLSLTVSHPSSVSVYLPPFLSFLVWMSDQFIGCGGLPVKGQTWEQLAVWLPYHSLWLISWQSLHYPELYAAIITPHPPTPQPVQDGPGLILLSSYPGGT